MLFAEPFSVLFWACYVCAGLSDLLDGIVARLLRQQSEIGARLDSIADLFFALCVAIVVVANVTLPLWAWICAGAIAAIRLAGYVIGYVKYHRFSAVHTVANKMTGGLVFALPLLCCALGVDAAAAVLCAAALLSSVEELAVTIVSKELDRDRKSIFCRSNAE